MLRGPALLLVFLAPVTQVSSNMEGDKTSVTMKIGSSFEMTCDLNTQSVNYIHWYKFGDRTAPRRLFYYDVYYKMTSYDSGIDRKKSRAYEGAEKKNKLLISNLEDSDSGTYRCAIWEQHEGCDSSGWRKTFGKGTELIVVPLASDLDADVSPKPTIFLPSIAEINLHRAGTYLCLLENFFPGVIKVSWKEKNDNRILQSQQGDTVKTSNTYMKLSWLTVPEKSMDKEHVCVVKHEKNKKGIDQQILFPSINQVVTLVTATPEPTNDCLKAKSKGTAVDSTKACPEDDSEAAVVNSTKACLKDENNTVRLQRESTSAYYAYLLLLLKSGLYFCVVAFLLLRRTAVCGHGKGS
ncbi:T cell receptor gamma constant 2 [Camelus ferus]|uniref:T cell receptor gamma constant 2 n=1 Tax=Camelus ferus TaxID=419612 RepID=UPI0013A5F68C|nr:T cell receptor gamma constant 2 [Camelus ferus]